MADPMNTPPDSDLRWYGSPTPGDAVRATIGLLHPGRMGAAVGASALAAGARVLWVDDGRSEATRARAEAAGLEEVHWLNGLVNRADLVIAVCPPAAAEEVAEEVTALGFSKVYVDANAISPATARRIAARIEETGASFVDGGIVGGVPRPGSTTRLYLSGAEAMRAGRMLAGGPLEVVVMDAPVGAASALKLADSAWVKGSTALLAAAHAMALAEGVDAALIEEWSRTQPELVSRLGRLGSTAAKAWRFAAEMDELATTFAAAGLPPGFAVAAADVYRRLERFKDLPDIPGGAELTRQLLPEA